jgi:hypothetical protein
MIALLGFVLAVLATSFKAKSRLEAENAAVCTEYLNTDIMVMKSAEQGV